MQEWPEDTVGTWRACHVLDMRHAAGILNLRGLSLKNLGRMEEALSSYDAAISAMPSSMLRPQEDR